MKTKILCITITTKINLEIKTTAISQYQIWKPKRIY